MALDQQYRKMLRDLMLGSDALSGQQTLPDGSIIGYDANTPDDMIAAVANPQPPMPEIQQQQIEQPKTPQRISDLLVSQRPQDFGDQQRFEEAYQFKQQMPEGQSYLRNNTTGAVRTLPSGQRQTSAAAPSNAFNDLIRFGQVNSIDPATIGRLIKYQSSVQAGMPSAKDLYTASFKYNKPIGEMLDYYGAAAAGQSAREKDRLGIEKQRAELAQLQAKPVDPEVSKQSSLMRMYNSIPDPKMRQAFGEKHGFATKPLTPNEKDPSVSEQTAAYHVGKMLTSLKNIQDLSKDDPSLLAPGAAEAAAVSMPFGDAYSGTANLARSANRQAIFAKQTDMLDALLYLATGAAYNKEQLEQKRNSLLPSFTDKPEAVAQKQLELQDYMNRAKIRAGKAWTPEMEGLLKTTMGVGGGKSMADQISKEAPPKITGQQPSAQRYRLKSPELNPKLKSSYEAY